MVAENTKENTEASGIVGDAGQAKAVSTPVADTLLKTENGSSRISPDPAKETESQENEPQSISRQMLGISRQIPNETRKQLLLLQILQDSAANLRDSGISVVISTKSRTLDDTALRIEINRASVCEECGWFTLYGLCPNPGCTSHKIPNTDKADKNTDQKTPTESMAFANGA